MIELDLKALRKVAEAATAGPWVQGYLNEVWAGGKAPIVNWQGFDDSDRGRAEHFANAAHIATFDPPTVLALLDRIEAAEKRLSHLDWWGREALNQALDNQRVRYESWPSTDTKEARP